MDKNKRYDKKLITFRAEISMKIVIEDEPFEEAPKIGQEKLDNLFESIKKAFPEFNWIYSTSMESITRIKKDD